MSEQFDQIIKEFRAERKWLYTLVTDPEGKRYFIPKDRSTYQQQFEEQIVRMTAFLEFCGNPQAQFRSVHVAGTSGKGSVTTMIAALLTACGQRTGDHISPYLQLSLEKLRVDGVMVAPSEFTQLVRDFRQKYEQWVANGEWLKYGEAWVALTFLYFAQEKPDWAVIETGMGGRYDPTNVVPSELAVVTNVDYDHVQSLGATLPEIAAHKAGIIKHGGRVLTAAVKPEVIAVIEAESQSKQATLRHLDYQIHENGTVSVKTPAHSFEQLELAVTGTYQKLNAATAIAAVSWLSEAGEFELTESAIHQAFADLEYAGRFEIMQQAPLIILDGAHNPHKMRAFVQSVQAAYPDQKFSVLFGMIVSKEADGIIEALAPIVQRFIVSEPKVFGKPPQPASEVADRIRAVVDDAEIHLYPDVQDGIDFFEQSATENDKLLVTGSIYLIGEARERWYPQEDILRELEQKKTG